jgi:outer membrane lipopolysaccharide assembly protein LptE/RlpB
MRRMRRLVTWVTLVAAAAAPLAGCGYALQGKVNSLPTAIRKIGVPVFTNLSTTPELDQMFTEAVRTEFRSLGKYTILQEAAGADAVLTGSIKSVDYVPQGFTADTRQGSKYSVAVVASVEFKQTGVDKPLFVQPAWRMNDEYDAPNNVAVGDLASLFAQDRNALERLAKTFAQRLVAAIRDNF